jgi:hypothetical protein
LTHPSQQVYTLYVDPWKEGREGPVQFRLTFQGRLPAASRDDPRAEDKHTIRRQLHPQLAALWKAHPFLEYYTNATVPEADRLDAKQISFVEHLANKYRRCGHRFVPLIGEYFGPNRTLGCKLDILFLRADHPPGAIVSRRDIDNRIKVLLDALQMPVSCGGLPEKPGLYEDPLYVLLEDDRLITELRVTTDRLFVPNSPTHPLSDVLLVIHVQTLNMGSSGYSAFTA